MNAENLQATTTPTGAAVSRASVLLIFAFLGVESALVPSGEVRDPARTVPRAIFVAMGAVTVLYVAMQIVAQGILGTALAATATPLARRRGVVLGPRARTLILVGIVGLDVRLRERDDAGRAAHAVRVRARRLPARRARARASALPHAARGDRGADGARRAALALLAERSSSSRSSRTSRRCSSTPRAVSPRRELRRRDVRAGGMPFRVPGGRVVPGSPCGVIAWLLSSDHDRRVERPRCSSLAAAIVVYVVTRPSRRARVAQTA